MHSITAPCENKSSPGRIFLMRQYNNFIVTIKTTYGLHIGTAGNMHGVICLISKLSGLPWLHHGQ